MNIGIVGSRRRNSPNDKTKLKIVVLKYLIEFGKENVRIISGGCPLGGDRFAEELAKEFGLAILIYYPDWKGKGKRAGFYRNTFIANDSDILIALVAEDRKGGTEDTIDKFKSNLKKYKKRKDSLRIL